MSKDNPTKNLDAPNKKRVSYSQFSNWWKCRHRWWLDKVKGLSEFEDSINTCFGTAIHEALQLFIETLYKESATKANEHDLHQIFKTGFVKELTKAKEKAKDKNGSFEYTD